RGAAELGHALVRPGKAGLLRRADCGDGHEFEELTERRLSPAGQPPFRLHCAQPGECTAPGRAGHRLRRASATGSVPVSDRRSASSASSIRPTSLPPPIATRPPAVPPPPPPTILAAALAAAEESAPSGAPTAMA